MWVWGSRFGVLDSKVGGGSGLQVVRLRAFGFRDSRRVRQLQLRVSFAPHGKENRERLRASQLFAESKRV